jgi:hypothetical protein
MNRNLKMRRRWQRIRPQLEGGQGPVQAPSLCAEPIESRLRLRASASDRAGRPGRPGLRIQDISESCLHVATARALVPAPPSSTPSSTPPHPSPATASPTPRSCQPIRPFPSRALPPSSSSPQSVESSGGGGGERGDGLATHPFALDRFVRRRRRRRRRRRQRRRRRRWSAEPCREDAAAGRHGAAD